MKKNSNLDTAVDNALSEATGIQQAVNRFQTKNEKLSDEGQQIIGGIKSKVDALVSNLGKLKALVPEEVPA